MKKKSLKILMTLAAAAVPVFVLATPHFAYAGCSLISPSSGFVDCLFYGTSWLAELWFQIAGAFLTICGVLLNGTMVATLNISTIVANTPAIGTAWRTIRDFSSIFIIFLLLYASIKMILGMKDSGLGNLIKNIIIAGVLINFSLFITKLAVDTSNIVSLSFYNAIAPGQGVVTPSNGVQNLISNAFNDGGISNVFMQSLDIQKVAGGSAVGKATSTDPNLNRNITMAYVGGSVLMVTAAFSFIAAAVMFAVRLGVLILLMAFSPIYFIGMIFEDTKPYQKMWKDTLVAMCLFMPAYLFLMYVALSVINDPSFFNFARVTQTGSTASNGAVSYSTVGVILQYIIAFIFINTPILVAIKIANEGAVKVGDWGKAASKWTQGKLTQGAKIAGTSTWQATGGRAASKLAENEGLKNFASNWKVGGGLYQGIKATASGYDERLKKQVESRTKFGESLGYDQREMNTLQADTRKLQVDLADAQRSGNDALAGTLKGKIGKNKGKITDLENRRKENYAKRINTRSIDTIYSKIARKDKVAAAKLQIPIKEDAIKHEKDDLKEIKDDIKQLQKAITNNPAGTVGVTIPGINGTATPAQEATLNKLLDKQKDKIVDINKEEEALDKLRLTK